MEGEKKACMDNVYSLLVQVENEFVLFFRDDDDDVSVESLS